MLFITIGCAASFAQAQVSGTVFKDFNANGTKDNTASSNEVGMAGVKVIATNPAGSTLTVTYTGSGTATNGTGGYSVISGTLGQTRLEFVMPDAYTFASLGANGGTTVMFPTTATQNLAVNYPADFCQANPELVVPCYVGQGLTGPNATEPAMARFNYYGNDKYIGQSGYSMPTKVTDHQHIGATYGVAYSRLTKKAFVGAVLRRHVSYGPLGIGGIYEADPSSGTVTNWLTIETLAGIDAGTDTRDNTTLNSISANKNYDYAAFAQIGKQSLGDLEISDDGKVLYVVNVFQQSLVAINAATKALIGSYPITASALGLTCPQSDFRPWGLKYHKGKLYVGAVCTAQTSQLSTDIKAYVLEFDPANAGAGFSTYYSFALNYVRENGDDWHPWNEKSFDPGSNNPSPVDPTYTDDARNAQAILSDIEFDVDGSLILGLMDRHGMMFSSGNAPPDPTAKSTASTGAFTNGDILRVCSTSTGFVLECTKNFPYSGGGEFYDDHRQGGGGTGQVKEVAGGALAFLPGSGETASTSIDEYDVFENGISWWNNTTGVRNRAYMIIDKNAAGGAGKTAGLGDIELLCDAAPIEIGNRVWNDTDSDGIQDAGETGIAGVSVSLCTGAGTPIATAVTDANGTYYFSSGAGSNTGSAIYGILGLTANTAYQVKFPTTNAGKSLVTANATADNLDSDAPASGVVSFSTASFGQNNHTFDVGYGAATALCSLTATAIPGTCNPAINQYTVTGTISLTSNTAGGVATITDGAKSTTVTVAASATSVAYSLSGLTSGTGSHTVTISLPGCGTAVATYAAPASCTAAACSMKVVITAGACNSASNTYAVTGVISATNSTGIQSLTISDGSKTTTVTMTGSTPVSFTLTGLTADALKHTLAVLSSATTCSMASTTYSAPASCATQACTPGVFAYWAFEDCSGGSHTVLDGFDPTSQNLNGCSGLTVSKLSRATSGNSCQERADGTLASCMGSSDLAAWVDGSNKALSFTMTYPAGSTGQLTSINFDANSPSIVDLNLSSTGTINNTPTKWGIRVLKNGIEIFKSIDNALTIDQWKAYMLDWSTNSAFAISGATTFSFEIMGYAPAGISGTIKEVWDIDEVKVNGYCGTCANCSLTATATAGVCNTATNQFSVTGTISLTGNTTGGVATITNGAKSTTVTVAASATSVAYSLTGLTSDATSHTIIVSLPVCGSVSVTYTAPASCTIAPMALALVLATPVCNTVTNQYTTTGTVSLTNTTAGSLTITDNGSIIGVVSVTAGQTTANFSVSGVSGSNPAAHTVVAALGTATVSTTYATPASCTVCSLSVTTASLPNGQVGIAYSQTITASGGITPYSYTMLGTLPAGLTLNVTGVISGTPTSATNASFTIKVTDSKSCSDTQPLTIITSALPVCSLTATATPGTCNSTTNQYTVTGTVSVTNTTGNQSLTILVGSISTTATLTGNGPVSFTLIGLTSDGLVKTVSILSSAPACGLTSVTYAAPATCTVAACGLTMVVSPGTCNSSTNQYSISGTVSLTNALAGMLTITDGLSSTTLAVTAASTAIPYSLTGLTSGSGSHTVTAALVGCGSTWSIYAAPTACTICTVNLTTVTLPAGQVGIPYSQTLTTTGGTIPYSYTISSGTLPTGLLLNATTGVISGTPTGTGTASFTVRVSDGKSCSDVASLNITTSSSPVCALTVTATPGTCSTATNTYIVTGTVLATNAISPQSLTISVGSVTTIVTLTGNGPVSYTLTGLFSDGLAKIVSVVSSATACGNTSVTYTAPAACSTCNIDLTSRSLPIGKVGRAYSATLTATSGTGPYSFAVLGNSLPNGLTLNPITGIISGTPVSSGSYPTTLVITDAKGCSAVVPLTVLQIDLADVCGLSLTVTPGSCQSATNQYSISGLVSLTNALAGTLTITDGLSSTTLAVTAASTAIPYLLTGLTSGGGSHTVTATLSGCGSTWSIYAAPTACTVTVPALAINVSPPVCNSATNIYSATGTVSLTNTPSGSLTITDNGNSLTVITIIAGQVSASFSITGISNGPSVRTITASVGGLTASTTYTTPASCSNCTYPVVVASASSSTVSEGQSATLTAAVTSAGSYTYVWTAPAGTSLTSSSSVSVIITSALPSGVHTFTVNVINQAGCSTVSTVCVSVPFMVCQGSDFAFELSAPTGYSNYEWRYAAPGSATSTVVQSSPIASYMATQAGEYSVQTSSGNSGCNDGSCCPTIISEIPSPAPPSLTGLAATCSQTANAANSDARIVLSGTALSGLTYNIVKGSSYTAASPLFTVNQPLPTISGSVLATSLVNPTATIGDTYTVRIVSPGGCFVDVVVVIMPITCNCPPVKCVPFVVRKIRVANR